MSTKKSLVRASGAAQTRMIAGTALRVLQEDAISNIVQIASLKPLDYSELRAFLFINSTPKISINCAGDYNFQGYLSLRFMFSALTP